jgi:RNA polymerase sigma factor (sigma-70 family)
VNTTEKLVIDHLRLAKAIAFRRKRTIPNQVTLEELQSAAYMGLVDASKRYDGVQPFSVFARPRIEGAITDYLRELRWGSRRSPVHATELQDSGKEVEGFDDLFEVVGQSTNSRVKNILKWHFIEGETQTEIATKLGVTRASVNQTIKGFAKNARERWTYASLCG